MLTYKTKVSVRTTSEENAIFNKCDELLGNIIDTMVENDCDEMASHLTGELVELKELRRMRGILSGMSIMTTMYDSKSSKGIYDE